MTGSFGRLPLPVSEADRRARTAAVAEIARRVALGRYRIPADRIADAVLAFHRPSASGSQPVTALPPLMTGRSPLAL